MDGHTRNKNHFLRYDPIFTKTNKLYKYAHTSGCASTALIKYRQMSEGKHTRTVNNDYL